MGFPRKVWSEKVVRAEDREDVEFVDELSPSDLVGRSPCLNLKHSREIRFGRERSRSRWRGKNPSGVNCTGVDEVRFGPG